MSSSKYGNQLSALPKENGFPFHLTHKILKEIIAGNTCHWREYNDRICFSRNCSVSRNKTKSILKVFSEVPQNPLIDTRLSVLSPSVHPSVCHALVQLIPCMSRSEFFIVTLGIILALLVYFQMDSYFCKVILQYQATL